MGMCPKLLPPLVCRDCGGDNDNESGNLVEPCPELATEPVLILLR